MIYESLYLEFKRSDNSRLRKTEVEFDQKEARERLIRFADNSLFLDANRETLMQKYAGTWIGIHNKQVIAIGYDFADVREKLREAVINNVGELVEFLTDDGIHRLNGENGD